MKKLTCFLKHTIVLILFIVNIPMAFSRQSGSTVAEAMKTKKGDFVYMIIDVPGLASRNETGEVTGVLVDLMRAFEDHLDQKYGLSVTSRFSSVPDNQFETFMSELKQSKGGVFGLGNLSITKQRQQEYDITDPYLNNIAVLITDKNVPTLSSMSAISEEFSALTPHSVANSANYEILQNIRKKYYSKMPEIQLMDSEEDVAMHVANNCDDCYGFVDALYYVLLRKKGLKIKRHNVGDQGNDSFGVFSPKNSGWTLLLNDFLKDFLVTAEYRQIITRHFGLGELRLIPGAEKRN